MIELRGLVLCGGQSRRMGSDKSWLQYHGIPQSLYTFRLLKEICSNVDVSVFPGQKMPEELSSFLIQDEFQQIGPAGGILSAHLKHPKSALLVMACDMPLVGVTDLQLLVEARGKDFVAFKDETLPSIWEPRALKALQENVERQEFSLFKTLRAIDGTFLAPMDASNLQNFNGTLELA